MRLILALGAAVLSLVPAGVQARPQQQLDCPVAGAPTGLAAAMVDKLFVTNEPAPEMFATLLEVAAGCGDRFIIPGEQREDYFTYALARLMREELALRIARLGVPAEVVDEVIGIGPGRENPVIKSMSDEQGDKLIAAVAAKGVDVSKITTATWNLVGGYVGAASQQYVSLRKLD